MYWPHNRISLCKLCRIKCHSNTKIRNLNKTIIFNHYILWFNIPMNYISLVCVCQPISKLTHNINYLSQSKSTSLLQQLFKCLTIYIFHYYIIITIFFSYIIYLNNIRMRQIRYRKSFSLKTTNKLLIIRKISS